MSVVPVLFLEVQLQIPARGRCEQHAIKHRNDKGVHKSSVASNCAEHSKHKKHEIHSMPMCASSMNNVEGWWWLQTRGPRGEEEGQENAEMLGNQCFPLKCWYAISVCPAGCAVLATQPPQGEKNEGTVKFETSCGANAWISKEIQGKH